jgi:transposase
MKKNAAIASITFQEFLDKYPHDEACLEHLFAVRFGQGHVCPKCAGKAKWYRMQAERAYACGLCGHHLHPTAGTLFEDTRTPLKLWFYAFYLFTTSRHGVPAKELERQLGVTYKTAWRMADLIRKHMAQIDDEWPLFSEPLNAACEVAWSETGRSQSLRMATIADVLAGRSLAAYWQA